MRRRVGHISPTTTPPTHPPLSIQPEKWQVSYLTKGEHPTPTQPFTSFLYSRTELTTFTSIITPPPSKHSPRYRSPHALIPTHPLLNPTCKTAPFPSREEKRKL